MSDNEVTVTLTRAEAEALADSCSGVGAVVTAHAKLRSAIGTPRFQAHLSNNDKDTGVYWVWDYAPGRNCLIATFHRNHPYGALSAARAYADELNDDEDLVKP